MSEGNQLLLVRSARDVTSRERRGFSLEQKVEERARGNRRDFTNNVPCVPGEWQVWGSWGGGVQDGCTELQGDGKLSISNSDENGDDSANINMLKCCDSRHKRHFDVLTVAA